MASDKGNFFQAGLYGRYEKDCWSLGASADFGTTNDLSAKRKIEGATDTAITQAHYKANLISEQVLATYDVFGKKRCWKLKPFVGFINQQVNREGFTEEGNSGFELNVGSSSYHSARSELGILWEAPNTHSVRPFASLDWEHEFADRNTDFNANLVGVNSPATFHILGQEIGRDSAVVRAGLLLAQQGRFNVSLLYQGQFANQWQQNGGALEVGFQC